MYSDYTLYCSYYKGSLPAYLITLPNYLKLKLVRPGDFARISHSQRELEMSRAWTQDWTTWNHWAISPFLYRIFFSEGIQQRTPEWQNESDTAFNSQLPYVSWLAFGEVFLTSSVSNISSGSLQMCISLFFNVNRKKSSASESLLLVSSLESMRLRRTEQQLVSIACILSWSRTNNFSQFDEICRIPSSDQTWSLALIKVIKIKSILQLVLDLELVTKLVL